MPLHVVLAAAAVTLSVPMLYWGLASERGPGPRVAARVLLRNGRTVDTDLRQAMLRQSARERALTPVVERMAARARRFTPRGLVSGIEKQMRLAGAQDWTLERVLAAKLGLGITGALIGGASVMSNPSPTGVFGFLALSVGAYLVPDWLLARRATDRQAEIERTLADTIDQITITVEAGLGFNAAMARVAKAGTGPLSEELGRTVQDVQLGMSRGDAFLRLAERTDVDDLRRFVAVMRQAEAYGVPVAHVLRTQARELRDKRRQRAEEKAMKVPVKILFPLIFCILPTLFIVILGPAVVRIGENGLGG